MDEIDNLFNEIISAINIATNLNSSFSDRARANKFIEDIKENLITDFEKVFKISMKLICFVPDDFKIDENSKNSINLSNIHNFGFQIIEILVKCNWNKLTNAFKNELKVITLNFICKKNINDTVLYFVYTNNLLKDQFSKLIVEILFREWPQNWNDFLNICFSQKENELVIYTLWRLSENLGIFHLPSNAFRRKQLNVAVKEEFNNIIIYLKSCLIIENLNLSILSLKTLNSFLEWCTIDEQLLIFLCNIYSVRFENTDKMITIFNCASDCLLTCLNRKSCKANEKLIFLVLFDESNISFLIDFLKDFLPFFNKKIESKIIDEQALYLVKKICNIFSLMGQTFLKTYSNSNQFPTTWNIYLELMMQMFQDDNQIYNYYAIQFWKDLFKLKLNLSFSLNEELSFNIINLLPNKMLKRTQIENIFLLHEFDELDYESFFNKFKFELDELFKFLIKENQKVCLKLSFTLIKQQFQLNNLEKNKCEISTHILSTVLNNLDCSKLESYCEEALQIFIFILNIPNIEDSELLSIILSALSALSIFIKISPNKQQLYQQLISKLFEIINSSFISKDQKCKTIISLRRHVCALFVKLCLKSDNFLLPFFDEILRYIKNLDENKVLSLLEKCLFYEGLVILSNNFSNQQDFIVEIFKPITWLLEYNQSCNEFMIYIGLTSPIEEWENYSINRSNLSFAVNLIMIILKRISKKEILIPQIFEYIYSLNKIILNLNEMWKPEYQSLCYPTYKNEIYNFLEENERISILKSQYIVVENKKNTELNRMTAFLWLLHENCYSALGCSVKKFVPELYYNLDLTLILKNADYLPNLKFKMILKTFLKPLLGSCPNYKNIHDQKIYPFLYEILPYFFKLINNNWEKFKQNQTLEDKLDLETNNKEIEEEILQQEITRSLSKDYIDFLEIIFLIQSNEEQTLSVLGEFLIQKIPDIIFIVTTSMTWLDSIVSFRATTLAIKLIDKIIEKNLVQSVDQISILFNHVLIAISYFGEDEQNQSILILFFLKIYENYVQKLHINEIKIKLAQFCGNLVRDWDNFDKNYRSCLNLKKKKDSLKILLNNAIGKNLSDLYKINKEEIKNLTPILIKKKKDADLDISEYGLWKLFETD